MRGSLSVSRDMCGTHSSAEWEERRRGDQRRRGEAEQLISVIDQAHLYFLHNQTATSLSIPTPAPGHREQIYPTKMSYYSMRHLIRRIKAVSTEPLDVFNRYLKCKGAVTYLSFAGLISGDPKTLKP